ncbi:MAG: cell wall hydrolase [Pseudomonadota bacterium]
MSALGPDGALDAAAQTELSRDAPPAPLIRRTVRLGQGGQIAFGAPSIWGLRISGRDTVAALAPDRDIAGAARLGFGPLRDLTPPPSVSADAERLAAMVESDDGARQILEDNVFPGVDPEFARQLGVSFMEGKDRMAGAPEMARREQRCLAEAIYHEARGEPLEGQVAVAEVVLNRVESRFWPRTICGVVNQGSERSTGCQFSYTCDDIPDRIAPGRSWRLAMRLAAFMMRGGPRRLTGRATHYHADYVDPVWARTMEETAVIGRHIFYRRLLRFTVEQ